jgi:hypothetical protein
MSGCFQLMLQLHKHPAIPLFQLLCQFYKISHLLFFIRLVHSYQPVFKTAFIDYHRTIVNKKAQPYDRAFCWGSYSLTAEYIAYKYRNKDNDQDSGLVFCH